MTTVYENTDVDVDRKVSIIMKSNTRCLNIVSKDDNAFMEGTLTVKDNGSYSVRMGNGVVYTSNSEEPTFYFRKTSDAQLPLMSSVKMGTPAKNIPRVTGRSTVGTLPSIGGKKTRRIKKTRRRKSKRRN